MKLTYITNTNLNVSSGGGSGVNNATYNELGKHFKITSVQVINPSEDLLTKMVSKIRRTLKLKGQYHFYSEKRLNKIASEYDHGDTSDAQIVFFNGFTPWINIKPQKPYYCFNDACFGTYIDIYNTKSDFLIKDIKRIELKEKIWLQNATKVFFRSQWALEQTCQKYCLKGDNFVNVGLGGFIDIPKKDTYEQGFNLLFISREFLPKGGLTAVKALQIIRRKYPTAELWIVGEKPDESILKLDGVNYKGFFRKNIPNEKLALFNIFRKSFALIHPTVKDVNSLVITELGYFGCPAISTNAFAIPEYIKNGSTGLLLDDPRNHLQLAEKIVFLFDNPDIYRRMRKEVREYTTQNNTWDIVGDRIIKAIKMQA